MVFAPEERNICRNRNPKNNHTPLGVLYKIDCVFVTIVNCILKVYTESKQINLMAMRKAGRIGLQQSGQLPDIPNEFFSLI
jgi:hypothetical protein